MRLATLLTLATTALALGACAVPAPLAAAAGDVVEATVKAFGGDSPGPPDARIPVEGPDLDIPPPLPPGFFDVSDRAVVRLFDSAAIMWEGMPTEEDIPWGLTVLERYATDGRFERREHEVGKLERGRWFARRGRICIEVEKVIICRRLVRDALGMPYLASVEGFRGEEKQARFHAPLRLPLQRFSGNLDPRDPEPAEAVVGPADMAMTYMCGPGFFNERRFLATPTPAAFGAAAARAGLSVGAKAAVQLECKVEPDRSLSACIVTKPERAEPMLQLATLSLAPQIRVREAHRDCPPIGGRRVLIDMSLTREEGAPGSIFGKYRILETEKPPAGASAGGSPLALEPTQ